MRGKTKVLPREKKLKRICCEEGILFRFASDYIEVKFVAICQLPVTVITRINATLDLRTQMEAKLKI